MPFLNENIKGDDFKELKYAIHENGLDEMFSRYFTGIKYLPATDFDRTGHYLHPEKYGENALGL